MPDNKKITTSSERGNALFLILIAVALFAALSYAVTQSGRGSGTIDRETALIAAAQLTQYPASLRTTITRMVITGTPVGGATGVDFTTGSASNKVFDSQGGGAIFQSPPNNIGTASGEGQDQDGVLDASKWGFKDAVHANLGFYILGVGTDTIVSGREVFAYLHDITNAVCLQVNKGLGLSSTIAETGADVDLTLGVGKGVNAAGSAASTHTYDAVPAQAFGCVDANNGAGAAYDYYHALVEQ